MFFYGSSFLWCDYDVAVASQIVILIVWVQLPLVTPKKIAEIAQLVEHLFEAQGVGGSIPSLGTSLPDATQVKA